MRRVVVLLSTLGLTMAVAGTGAVTSEAADPDDVTVVAGWGVESSFDPPSGLSGVTSIAAAVGHVVALKSNGTVAVWGIDVPWGEVPTGLPPVTAVATGDRHHLALTDSGTVVAWGSNVYGQTNVPAGLTGVTAIAAAGNHSLAVKTDGTVVAWGSNAGRQTSVPVGLNQVAAVAAGSNHSLALKTDGTVVGWGSNLDGQTDVPSGLTGVTAIAAAGNHSLALTREGTVVAWGSNLYGLNNPPAGLTGVTAIAAGTNHNLTLTTEGAVVAWGNGALGETTTPPDLPALASIAGGSRITAGLKPDGTVVVWGGGDYGQAGSPASTAGAIAIDAGNGFSLALTRAGAVVAWGNNTVGQTDVPEAGGAQVTAISAGDAHSLALRSDGTVIAWGDNSYGQTEVPPGLADVTAVSAGRGYSLALRSDGSVVAWGRNDYEQTAVPTDLSGVAAIAAGWDWSLALKGDGTVVAWGADAAVPADLSDVTAIAGGAGFALALTSDGSVVGWGLSSYTKYVPDGLPPVIAIDVQFNHSVALTADRTVVAWGENKAGVTDVPADLSGVTAIAIGMDHALALQRLVSPSPTPVISGAARVDSLLIATAGTWGPAPVTLTYQWTRNGTAIPGATTPTYALVPADVGSTISITVTGSSPGYAPVQRTSAPTAAVARASLSPTPTPTTTGITKVGDYLTASPGTWGPAPVALTYQWRRNGVAIPGATEKSYTMWYADLGTRISVTVTGKKAGYSTVARTSASSASIGLGDLWLTNGPRITGIPRVGSVLTLTPGDWIPHVTVRETYQWLRDDTAITGATALTYKLTSADLGARIRVTVKGTKPGFKATVRTSPSTTFITPAALLSATPTPTISGTARVGNLLTARPGAWSPSPVTLAYRWKRNGVSISSATKSTYTVTATDKGTRLTVTVTGSKPGYKSVARTSSTTAVVLAAA